MSEDRFIKRGIEPAVHDALDLHRLADQAGEDLQGGIVFYDSESVLSLAGSGMLAVPISKFWTV